MPSGRLSLSLSASVSELFDDVQSGGLTRNRKRKGTMKPASVLATLFLGLVSVGHLLRLVLQVEVTAGSLRVPMWMSLVACVFTGGLAVALWLENRRR
jgi:hypothetical protein